MFSYCSLILEQLHTVSAIGRVDLWAKQIFGLFFTLESAPFDPIIGGSS